MVEYSLSALRKAATILKKTLASKMINVTKATKEQLIKFLKDNSYDMTTIKTIKTKGPKRVVGPAIRAIYPARPRYSIKALRKEAIAVKKANKLRVSVGKMTQSELINFISSPGEGLKGRGLSGAVMKLTPGKMTAYQKKGNMPIGFPPAKRRGRPPKTSAVPAQVVAGQRKVRKQRSDKGKKRGPRA